MTRFDLSEDASIETAMIFGEIYRHNNEWKFRAVGQGYAGGLKALAIQHGIQLNLQHFFLTSQKRYPNG
jgi:tellurium resistance protein TerD